MNPFQASVCLRIGMTYTCSVLMWLRIKQHYTMTELTWYVVLHTWGGDEQSLLTVRDTTINC
jgi:hypothetical protein